MNETTGFVTKDSGERRHFESGMQRDTTTGKLLYHLVRFGPMFLRWVSLLTRGAVKYEENNWMKANGPAELKRFIESADRHFAVWMTYRLTGVNIEDPENPTRKPLTEDHAAAVFFNINGAEYVADQQPVQVNKSAAAEANDFINELKKAKAEEDARNAKHRQDVERQRIEEEQRIDREIAEVKKRIADRANQAKQRTYQEELMKDGAKPLPLLPGQLDPNPGYPVIKKEMHRIVQHVSGAELREAGFLGEAFDPDSSWSITVERQRY